MKALHLFAAAVAMAALGCAPKKVGIYAVGELDVVYNVEVARGRMGAGGKITNWVTVSNFIGSGTNAAPELIGLVNANKTNLYRVRPE